MMNVTELAMARGATLLILRDYLQRPREVSSTSDPTYMVEDLLIELLSRRGYSLPEAEFRGAVLFYLEDAKFIEYQPIKPAGPTGLTMLRWRITHNGYQIAEGTRLDPGVKVF